MPFTAYDAAMHAIRRARRLLNASRQSISPFLSVIVRADLRRLGTVMAVAALDTYMHRLIVERAFTHRELPPALAKVGIPFGQLLRQADAARVSARSTRPRNTRPRVAVKRQLRARLLRETFQRFDDVAEALSMAGRGGSWDAIGREMNPAMTPREIRTRLNRIVVRRNQIVHEGDYRPLERPRNPRRNPMSHSQAESDIDFLADLIDAIHAVVST